MNSINLKFMVKGNPLPFIKIQFKDMDGKRYSALMLMDTGSNINILAAEMAALIDKNDWLEETSDEIVDVYGEVSELPLAMFNFEMDGQPFQEIFVVEPLVQPDDVKIVGVLGNCFMQKYRLAIDYANMTVHTSNVTAEELNNIKFEFVIPIEYGLRHYNTPIFHLKRKKHSAVAVVDTSCDDFTITQRAVDECRLDYHLTGNIQEVSSPKGSVDGKECVLNFCLTDHKGNKIGSQSFQETAVIIPSIPDVLEDGECDEDGNLLPPVDGLIGSPFMAKQKWVIDFGTKAIYKFSVLYI